MAQVVGATGEWCGGQLGGWGRRDGAIGAVLESACLVRRAGAGQAVATVMVPRLAAGRLKSVRCRATASSGAQGRVVQAGRCVGY